MFSSCFASPPWWRWLDKFLLLRNLRLDEIKKRISEDQLWQRNLKETSKAFLAASSFQSANKIKLLRLSKENLINSIVILFPHTSFFSLSGKICRVFESNLTNQHNFEQCQIETWQSGKRGIRNLATLVRSLAHVWLNYARRSDLICAAGFSALLVCWS